MRILSKTFLAWAGAATFIAPGAIARPVDDTIAPAENQIIDAFSNQLFTELAAGKSLSAVNAFLGRSKLMAGKSQELTLLASQIDGTIGIYGTIGNCLLFSESSRAGIVQVRSYLCQHQQYLTRWTLTFGKTANGWEPLMLNFDDKIAEGL